MRRRSALHHAASLRGGSVLLAAGLAAAACLAAGCVKSFEPEPGRVLCGDVGLSPVRGPVTGVLVSACLPAAQCKEESLRPLLCAAADADCAKGVCQKGQCKAHFVAALSTAIASACEGNSDAETCPTAGEVACSCRFAIPAGRSLVCRCEC
jgi:hypothetical protein